MGWHPRCGVFCISPDYVVLYITPKRYIPRRGDHNVYAWSYCAVRNRNTGRATDGWTDKKFESHCRVPPHLLSTGCNVLIPSDRLRCVPIRPSQQPRITCPRTRDHGVRPSGRTSPWWAARPPGHHEEVRQRPRRNGLAPSGPGPGGRPQLEMAQDTTDDGPAGQGCDDPQAARLTERTPLQVEDKHAFEQAGPRPARRDRTGFRLDPVLARRWGDDPSPLAVCGQTTCVPPLVHPRRGHQGRQLLQQLQRQ
jgi:hypothetical protein